MFSDIPVILELGSNIISLILVSILTGACLFFAIKMFFVSKFFDTKVITHSDRVE